MQSQIDSMQIESDLNRVSCVARYAKISHLPLTVERERCDTFMRLGLFLLFGVLLCLNQCTPPFYIFPLRLLYSSLPNLQSHSFRFINNHSFLFALQGDATVFFSNDLLSSLVSHLVAFLWQLCTSQQRQPLIVSNQPYSARLFWKCLFSVHSFFVVEFSMC